MKETKNYSSMDEFKNLILISCHCDKIVVIGVAQLKANIGRNYFILIMSISKCN
jgi:hypothetical protein